MSITITKQRIARYAIGLVGVVTLALIVIYSQRNSIAMGMLEQRLDSVERRLGVEFTVSGLDVNSLTEVNLDAVEVVHDGRTRIRIDRTSVALESPSFALKAPKPMAAKVAEVAVSLDSQGGLAGLVSDIQHLASLRKKSIRKAQSNSKKRGPPRISNLEIERIYLDDAAEWIDAELRSVRVVKGAFEAKLTLAKPVSASCELSGTLSEISMKCDKPLRVGNERLGFVTVASADFKRKPTETLELSGVGVELSERIPSVLRAVFEGLRADLTVSRPDAQTGKVPLQLSFLLPGGGRIDGSGSVSPLGGVVQASVEGIKFGDELSSASGRISGEYKLEVSLLEQSLQLKGLGQVSSFSVSHDALAEAPIGPFDIALGGALSVGRADNGIRVEIRKGQFGLGELKAGFELDFFRQDERWRIALDAQSEPLEFQSLVDSIPANLLPHLEGLKASGPLSSVLKLNIDSEKLDDTKLDIDIDTSKFKIKRLSKALDFFALRHLFMTRFEMPEDEDGDRVIYRRELGPASDRFVPLSDMTPLLPLAVMAQEDASFRKHKGISLFHLRGSLIDNLKKGRFVRGGSTVTMQLARNLFLNRRKTLSRKLEEIVVAWLLEQYFDKDELMTLYLNVVEFGPDIFGVKEAAAHYFNCHPRALSPAQTAWLIKLLPGPRLYYSQFEKKRLSKAFKENLNWLMRHMIRKGFMTQEQYEPVTETSLFDVQVEDNVPALPQDVGIPSGEL